MDRRVNPPRVTRRIYDRIRHKYRRGASPNDDGYNRFLDEGLDIYGDHKHFEKPRQDGSKRSYGLDRAHDALSDPVFMYLGCEEVPKSSQAVFLPFNITSGIRYPTIHYDQLVGQYEPSQPPGFYNSEGCPSR